MTCPATIPSRPPPRRRQHELCAREAAREGSPADDAVASSIIGASGSLARSVDRISPLPVDGWAGPRLMTDAYPSLPLRDAVELNQRALAGDAEARAFFDGLFQPEAECFTCADPVGAHVVAQIIGDPIDKSRALIVPICGAKCGALPHLYLRHRVTKIAKAIQAEVETIRKLVR